MFPFIDITHLSFYVGESIPRSIEYSLVDNAMFMLIVDGKKVPRNDDNFSNLIT